MNLKLESPNAPNDHTQNFANMQSSQLPTSQLNFKANTLQYNPSTQNLMINLANHTMNQIQTGTGYQSATNASSMSNLSGMQILGSSLTPHSGQHSLNPQPHFINLQTNHAAKNQPQSYNQSQMSIHHNQNTTNLLSGQKQQTASKSSMSTHSNGPSQNQNPNGSSGTYSSLASHSKKQVKPQMSSYNSIKNLRNEVKSLFEPEDLSDKHQGSNFQNVKGKTQTIQQTHFNQDGASIKNNSNSNYHQPSKTSNTKNPEASSRSTATHQYSMSSMSQHQPQTNPSQYENISSPTAGTNQVGLNHLNSKQKAQTSNTFIQFGKKNSLRQNSESLSNLHIPQHTQQQTVAANASQNSIAHNYLKSQPQSSLQERQRSVDQDYMQYIQNFTIQDADGINQYGGNEGINSSQLMNRALTSSPPISQLQVSQNYNADSSVLRIQTGVFSPGTQSNSQMTHHIMPQTTVHGQNSSVSALGGAVSVSNHPITSKHGHSKKVSYFGTKAPTFKVQNSITKSQSNKNLINDKFQSQGFQLANGNNPLQSQLHPQMSVSNLLLARAGGQIINGINTSQPVANHQNFFVNHLCQQNSLIYNQNEQSQLINQHNPLALSQKISQQHEIKMTDLINSQAKKPYESKGKKSMMNESSQMIAVHVETLPSQSLYRDGQLVHYVQSRTALDNYRQSTELNFYQKHSQSLANSNENISRAQDGEGTFCSMKDSLQYVVSDEGILAHQQEVHDLQQSIEKESALKRKKFSTEMQAQLQVTPIGKSNNLELLTGGQGRVNQRPAHQFNQTILQPTMTTNLFSPGDNLTGSAFQVGASTSQKNKTQKLNKMLKTLISDNNISYNTVGQKMQCPQQNTQGQLNAHPHSQVVYQHSLSQPNLHAALQNQNTNNSNIVGVGLSINVVNGSAGLARTNSKLQISAAAGAKAVIAGSSSNQGGISQTGKKEASQSKTAIMNFKKQAKGGKGQNKQQINIQSSVKPSNQHKVIKNPQQTSQKDCQQLEKRRTPLDNYNTVQPQAQLSSQPIQIDLYQHGQQQQASPQYQELNQQKVHNEHTSFPNNPIGDQLQLMLQIESLRKEVEDLKYYKLQAITKDKEIQHLKKKLQTVGQEKARLRNQVSANRAGGVGGLIEQSSGNITSGGEATSTSKKVDKSALSSGGGSRQYAKPFQQLVSHIKSKARNQMSLDSQDKQEVLSPQVTSQTKELMGLPIINENMIKSLNQQNFSTRNRKPHQSNNGVTSGHRLLNGNQMHVQSQPLLISPSQIVSGVGLVNSPSVAHGLNNFSAQSKQHLLQFSKQLQEGKTIEEGLMRMSSPVFNIEDQSPPLKLKRVVSQRSIDSVSNYSSSQQKRENLRYKRSHDEYGNNQEEDKSGDQSTLDKPKQQTEDMSEPVTCLEYVLPESVSIQQKSSTINTSDIKIAQSLVRVNSSQINYLQQNLDTDSLEQTSELRTVPQSARLPLNTSNETLQSFKTSQELDKLKTRVGGFIQNYVNYIRYLENKVRRLEEKEQNQS